MTDNVFNIYYKRFNDWGKFAAGEHYGTPEHLQLVRNVCKEEHKELNKGITENNPTEILDGLCDSFVMLSQWVSLVPKENLTDCFYNNDVVDLRTYIGVAHHIINDEVDSQCLYALSALTRYFDVCPYDIEGALCEVARSNDTKFPLVQEVKDVYGDNEEEALKAACDWIEDQGEYKGITCEVREGKVVFKADTGKIVKWSGFSKPQLDKYLNRGNEL